MGNKEMSAAKKMVLEGAVKEKPKGAKAVSYSQYSVYKECPHRWNLTYKEGLFPFTSTVNTTFGTAFHNTLQAWLSILYTESVKKAEEFDFRDRLSDEMVKAYVEELKENGGVHFIKKEEQLEYYEDGIEILEYLRRKRKVLFDYRTMELVAVELPMYVQVAEGKQILFNGFLDLVFYDKENKCYEIVDVKTSTRGWKQGGYEMKSQVKMNQVLLYKHFFSKHYNVDQADINVKFLIVKRKVSQFDGYDLPRHTMHMPAQGTARVKQAVNDLESFINDCFNPNGSFRQGSIFKKIPGKACRFCPFANTDKCNMEAD